MSFSLSLSLRLLTRYYPLMSIVQQEKRLLGQSRGRAAGVSLCRQSARKASRSTKQSLLPNLPIRHWNQAQSHSGRLDFSLFNIDRVCLSIHRLDISGSIIIIRVTSIETYGCHLTRSTSEMESNQITKKKKGDRETGRKKADGKKIKKHRRVYDR